MTHFDIRNNLEHIFLLFCMSDWPCVWFVVSSCDIWDLRNAKMVMDSMDQHQWYFEGSTELESFTDHLMGFSAMWPMPKYLFNSYLFTEVSALPRSPRSFVLLLEENTIGLLRQNRRCFSILCQRNMMGQQRGTMLGLALCEECSRALYWMREDRKDHESWYPTCWGFTISMNLESLLTTSKGELYN